MKINDDILGELYFDELWTTEIFSPALESNLVIQIESSSEPSELQLHEARNVFISLDDLVRDIKARLYVYYQGIPDSEKRKLRFPELAFPKINTEDEIFTVFKEPGLYVSEENESQSVILEWIVNWGVNDTYALTIENGNVTNEEFIRRD